MNKRRWLSRIVVCLVFGAVTTVGVAWGLAMIRPRAAGGDRAGEVWAFASSGPDFVNWTVVRYDAPGQIEIRSDWQSPDVSTPRRFPDTADPLSVVPSWARYVQPYALGPELPVMIRGVVAHGWPLIAAYGGFELDEMGHRSGIPEIEFVGGFLSPFESGATGRNLYLVRLLPVIPIWPGFTIDTLFYAAIWLGLLYGPGSLRRLNRKLRGLCPMCKYKLRGNPEGVTGCAECGWDR